MASGYSSWTDEAVLGSARREESFSTKLNIQWGLPGFLLKQKKSEEEFASFNTIGVALPR